MATELKVPALGESITSGILAAWHVKEGEYVNKDQVLYELETDKITSEGLAEASGAITLLCEEGEEVEIGQTIASIDETQAAPDPPANASDEPTSTTTVEETESPAAIDEVKALPKPEANAAPVQKSPANKASPETRTTRKRLSPLRQKIAERLVSAQQEAAMLTTFNEVDLSKIKELCAAHQESFTETHGVKLGFMSFFVKATVRALQQLPAVNAMIDGDEVIQNHYYDIGIAVSTDKGLIVPVLRDCETLSLAGVEKSIRDYADKARAGKIGLDDLKGGVFTITNGGVFGSMLSTPILNPPQSAILGMHTIQDRPVAIDGQIVIRPMMYLALSYDHRIVDGREAVTFLVNIKKPLENPLHLLLDI